MIKLSCSFNTQFEFDEFDVYAFDDGEEVPGFVHGVVESPSTLLARLRAGESVGVHMPGNPVDDMDFFDLADEAERYGGSPGPGDLNDEDNSTYLEKNTPAAPEDRPSGPEDPSANPKNDENQG